MSKFNLTDDDYFAVEIAKNVTRRFLKHPSITPRQIIGLGNALYALEHLPDVTPGAFSVFGVHYRAGNEESSEMRFIDFQISDSAFGINKGGSVYDISVGSDSFSEPGLLIEINGYRHDECDLYNIEDTIEEYLNLGGAITVSDESEIEFK